MANLFKNSAPKRPTNVSINSDLLQKAKKLHINLSKTLEQRLIELLYENQRQQWLKENKEALDLYNERVEQRGVFGDGLRRF